MSKELLVFIESHRTEHNNDLINTILEGYAISTKDVQLEGIGDTIRNTFNKVKTAGAIGKETLFGSSEEKSIKNTVAKTLLNKNLYNSTSERGKQAINEILSIIQNGTQDENIPSDIAGIADDVLIDCLENALTGNPTIQIIIVDKEVLRDTMNNISAEIADSLDVPLHKLGKTRLNDDRYAVVSAWWDKNVVPKMGKYYSAFNNAEIAIRKKAPKKEQPQAKEPKPQPKPQPKPAPKKEPFIDPYDENGQLNASLRDVGIETKQNTRRKPAQPTTPTPTPTKTPTPRTRKPKQPIQQ